MPKPIVCLSEQLRQYLERFCGCFSKRQWKYFVIVLLGLVECEERKTLSGMRRVVAEEVSLCGISRFLNRWKWEPSKVAAVWAGWFRERMKALVQDEHERQRQERPQRRGRPKGTVVTGYLLMDDSVHVKPKGRKMGGMGQHYSNTERRVVNGHCLFSGQYHLLGQRCPLEPQLYAQQAVCEREKVPFQSKIDMAVALIEQFEPVENTHTHVLMDSWFHCKRVRKAAQNRGWDVSGGLKSNRCLRIIHPDGEREWIPLSTYAAGLSREDWQEINWPSQQGGQTMYAYLVITWIRKLGPTLLLITCHDLDQPLKSVRYWGSTKLDLDAQSLVNILAVRWEIETFFEYDKDLLGSDHYQLMSAQGILRFWILTSCLICFLEAQRSLHVEEYLTCGDIRRQLQEEHRRNLLQWLEIKFAEGHSLDNICEQLAI